MISLFRHKKESRYQFLWLDIWVIFFLFIFSLILTLSPMVRYQTSNVRLRWIHWIGFFIWLSGFLFFKNIYRAFVINKDPILINAIMLIIGWGILTIFRLRWYFGLRQSFWFLGCVALSYIIFRYKHFFLQIHRYKYILLVTGGILVSLTFLFGTYPSGIGPQLWLGGAGIYFQPSELLKILFIIFLSAYYSNPSLDLISDFQALLPSLFLFFISLTIIIFQRDLGTAIIFSWIYLVMVFIRFGRKRFLLYGLLFSLISGLIGYFTFDLVRIRLQSWIKPWVEAQSSSYQIIQAIISIAAGGLLGTGVGLGRPDYIPISHSDFIYASIVEETGLVGAVGLLIVFLIIFFRLASISQTGEKSFSTFLAVGVASYVIGQGILIMGGNVRLLPITGVTLPFMSYGGSSLMVSFAAVLIVLIYTDSPIADLRVHKNIQLLGILLIVGITMVGAATSWWSIIRSNDLQLRSDNPRHLITAKFIPRGSILDRNGEILAKTVGGPGTFQREYTHPPVSNSLGFISQRYGLSGIENHMDAYLSGYKGYNASKVWFNYILYDEPPPGRNIRLSIDLSLQKEIDKLLTDTLSGALVINPKTGEILAISSHPHINSNRISEDYDMWRKDLRSPFLNRVTQGNYPTGELITPLLLSAENLEMTKTESLNWKIRLGTDIPECANEISEKRTFNELITNGCTTAFYHVFFTLKEKDIIKIFSDFFIDASPEIGLEAILQSKVLPDSRWQELLIGESNIRFSPLLAAHVFSVFSNNGIQPSIDLVTAVNVNEVGWVITADETNKKVINAANAKEVANLLSSDQISGWEISARGIDLKGQVSWYIAGTDSDWLGNPVLVVLLVENSEAKNVREMGRNIFNIALSN